MAEEQQVSFKSRVLSTAVQYSHSYYNNYVCVDYLVISDAFHDRPYYIISAEKSNYLHLIGVSTHLSATAFFEKCYDGTLTESDFEISAHGQDAKTSKGSIRRKMNALPYIGSLIDGSSFIEEGFRKNAISCSIASSDGACTLGFIAVPAARPKTLLIGDELDHSKSAPIKVILVKTRGADSFNLIRSGSLEDLIPYYKTLSPLLGDDLKRHLEDLLSKENATKPNEGDFQQTEKAEHNDNQESSES